MQGFSGWFFSQNVTKKAPASRRFCLQGRMGFSDKLRSLGFPGRLAQIGADVPDLRSVLCHGLLGGLEHIITVVGHGLADGAGLGLGGRDDLGSALLRRF